MDFFFIMTWNNPSPFWDRTSNLRVLETLKHLLLLCDSLAALHKKELGVPKPKLPSYDLAPFSEAIYKKLGWAKRKTSWRICSSYELSKNLKTKDLAAHFWKQTSGTDGLWFDPAKQFFHFDIQLSALCYSPSYPVAFDWQKHSLFLLKQIVKTQLGAGDKWSALIQLLNILFLFWSPLIACVSRHINHQAEYPAVPKKGLLGGWRGPGDE